MRQSDISYYYNLDRKFCFSVEECTAFVVEDELLGFKIVIFQEDINPIYSFVSTLEEAYELLKQYLEECIGIDIDTIKNFKSTFFDI
ncbi:hypothetical protein [Virgibacillus sp. SK37]|uniref:hypothetical protein n=1 Tax=Virgibacillus sp. SK37 TaxID=403957 RepID=UPI0004D1773C|nr:hypothetical protein [Virgibacillus sp. SK37]AIF45652.1 hypothetical protein X953_18865 [Virgibacillus sp. SK37]